MKIILAGVLLAVLLVSCETDYKSPHYNDRTSEIHFDGSALDYLSQEGSGYDSMIYIIDAIPGLREQLSDPDKKYTLFAVPNSCFQSSIMSLNAYRKVHGSSTNVFMSDMFCEPFYAYDTTIVKKEVDGIMTEVEEVDSVYYDYKSQITNLLGRYITEGVYDSKILAGNFEGVGLPGLFDRYGMHASFHRTAASGIVGQGQRSITFSDMNDSQFKGWWVHTTTKMIDIYVDNGVIHELTPGHEFGFDKFIALFYNRYNEE